jgi:2'-5' RNA ligase
VSPLPERMENRWSSARGDTAPGDGTVYWHMLLGDDAEVRDLAALARARLSGFDGLHFTPDEWLHITTLAAGPRDKFSDSRLAEMSKATEEALSGWDPRPVTFGRILYHPQAIILEVEPKSALEPVRTVVQRTTGSVALNRETDHWIPHVTVAYSTASQPAGPIVAALGMRLPSCTATIRSVSLVVQWGPERSWDWEVVSTIRFGAALGRDFGIV